MVYVSTTHAHVKKLYKSALYKSALVLQTVNIWSPIFQQQKQLGPQRLWGLSYFATLQPALTYFVSRSLCDALNYHLHELRLQHLHDLRLQPCWHEGLEGMDLIWGSLQCQTYHDFDLGLKCSESCAPAVPRSCVLKDPYHSCAVGRFEMPSASLSFYVVFCDSQVSISMREKSWLSGES